MSLKSENLDIESRLPRLKYYRPNCMSECRQNSMINFCNCTMEILFPIFVIGFVLKCCKLN